MKLVFFGSSEFSVYVLDELLLHNIKPALIITTPDKPKGRKLVITPNPCKVWANEHGIEVIDPVSLKKDNASLISYLVTRNSNLFLVASYGKIIPKEIFEIPEKKTLNIHPSLLPKYRGASPIQSQILNDEKEIGVSIMVITEGMDEGPVVVRKVIPSQMSQNCTDISLLINSSCSAQSASQGNSETFASELQKTQNLGAEKIQVNKFGRIELEKILAKEGARLFAHILPEWMQGAIDPIMQNENEATYCKKIEKEDGLLDLNDDPYKNYLKIKALEGWPGTYFFLDTPKQSEGGPKNKRVIVKEATFENGQLKIIRVVPEGKKEMSYSDFLRGQK